VEKLLAGLEQPMHLMQQTFALGPRTWKALNQGSFTHADKPKPIACLETLRKQLLQWDTHIGFRQSMMLLMRMHMQLH